MDSTDVKETNKRRRWPKILLGLAVLLVVLGGAALLFGPEYARGLAEEKLTAALHRPVAVGRIVVKLFDLSVAIEKMSIGEKEDGKDFVGFSRFYAKWDPASIFKWALVLKSCRLEAPFVHIVRQPDLAYNFSDLIPKDTGQEEKKDKGKGLHFSINNIEITDGSIEFEDLPKKAVQRVTKLTLAIPFISNLDYLAQEYVTPVFSAEVNGAPVAIQGKSKPFSENRETSLDITIAAVNLPEYLTYLPGERKFTLRSGVLTGACTIFFTAKKGEKPLFQVGGDFDLKDFDMADTDSNRSFLGFSGLRVEMAPSRVLAPEININRVALASPRFDLERLNDGSLFPMTVFSGGNQQGPQNSETKADSAALQLQVAAIEITEGAVNFADRSTEPAFTTAIAPINLEMQHFSLARGTEAPFRVGLKTDGGETVTTEGRFTLEPLAVSGKLNVEGVGIARYAPYYQKFLAGRVGAGSLRLSSGFSHAAASEGATTRLSDLLVELSSLSLLDRKGKEFFNLPLLRVTGVNTDFAAASVNVGEVLFQDGKLTVQRDKDGHLNLEEFVKAPPSQPSAGKGAGKPEAASASMAGTGQGSAWKGELASVKLQNFSLTFEDRKPATPALTSISELNANASQLSLDTGKSFPVVITARLNKSGMIEAKGEIAPAPLNAKIDLGLKAIALPSFQPYVAEAANLIVKNGEASVRGGLELASQPKKPMQARFKGTAEVARLKALDVEGAEEIIHWGSLKIKNIDAATVPLRVSIDEVGLRDFLVKAVVSPDKKLNLGSLAKETEQQGEPQQQPAQPQPAASARGAEEQATQVKIKTVALEKGRVDFQDNSVSPGFSSSLTDIAGTLRGVNTMTTEPAELDLQAKIDGSAPLSITGKIRPVKADLYADIQVALSGADLTAATPYTGKYIGRTTEKGKLSLNLKYLIDKRQLTAENKALLDQFTLGETIASPDATDLPVGLALSLLKNRKGEVNLDLPVTGSLDDPQFSLAGIILKMIVNLIAKAATSPFALLGALIPEGVDLQYIAFPAGSADIVGDEAKKLDTLVTALNDRPGIKVDLTGHADPESDRQTLAEQNFKRLLQVQKAKELAKKAGGEEKPEEAEVRPDEYEKYLLLAYKAAPIERPKNVLRLDKTLPREEMERLLRESIKVADADLKALAGRRAGQVREQLITKGQVEQARIFLLEPKLEAGAEKGKPGQRVEMAIK